MYMRDMDYSKQNGVEGMATRHSIIDLLLWSAKLIDRVVSVSSYSVLGPRKELNELGS